MIYAVGNTKTREIVYTVENDCRNACTERDMLNAPYPLLDQPFIVIRGKRGIRAFTGKQPTKGGQSKSANGEPATF